MRRGAAGGDVTTFKSLDGRADTSEMSAWDGVERRRAGRPWRDRPRPLKVAVFTTSFPRDERDASGRFVADAVARLRAGGVTVEVVSPRLSGEGSVVAKVRRAPWRAPGFILRSVRALRRADADLVHAHWLLAGAVAALSRKPFVLTMHGSGSAGALSDLALSRRAPWLVGAIVRRARVVIAVSAPLADAARACGARDVRVIPNGVTLPAPTAETASTDCAPEILYVGRLSPEKGIDELVEACAGLNLVVAGDGPLRPLVPQARGFVSREELSVLYRRATVVVCPSRSEGFGVACAEAMAHARPVVATAVGGLQELVTDGRTGLLVEPRNPKALRAAIDRLLEQPALRRRLGRAARASVAERFAWEDVTDATVRAYRDALGAAEPQRPTDEPRVAVA
jgi:glycosyltransferase involved in cell wall biosynthesis